MKITATIAAFLFSIVAQAAAPQQTPAKPAEIVQKLRSPASQRELPPPGTPTVSPKELATKPTIDNECRLSNEQGSGSVIGTWEKLPITLVADRDLYLSDNGSGISALKSAAKTWNDWAARKGKVAFVFANEKTKGLEFPSVSACSHSEITNSSPNAVGIWKVTAERKSANRPAHCLSERKLVASGVQAQTDWALNGPKIENASILLNFETFNVPGRNFVDLESLLVHELGHVLGLLHSCNGSSHDSYDGTSSPACSAAPKEFVDALMFPYLPKGKIRRDIRQNDFDRINCLY